MDKNKLLYIICNLFPKDTDILKLKRFRKLLGKPIQLKIDQIEENFTSVLYSLRTHIDEHIKNFIEKGYRDIRLSYDYIVSSEDIKYITEADQIFCDRQISIGPVLVKKGIFIGYIDGYENCLGSDIIIEKIVIYDNPDLSKELTEKYKNKIMIFSEYKDCFTS